MGQIVQYCLIDSAFYNIINRTKLSREDGVPHSTRWQTKTARGGQPSATQLLGKASWLQDIAEAGGRQVEVGRQGPPSGHRKEPQSGI